jgi:hypothetical protein
MTGLDTDALRAVLDVDEDYPLGAVCALRDGSLRAQDPRAR